MTPPATLTPEEIDVIERDFCANLAKTDGDREALRKLCAQARLASRAREDALIQAIQIVGECRVLICETTPIAVAKETAEQLCDQLRRALQSGNGGTEG